MRAALLAVLTFSSQDPSKPVPFDEKGRLVCLLEQMQARHGVEIAPVHPHVLGFKLEGKVPAGGFRYDTVLRTLNAEGLFVDKRVKDRELCEEPSKEE